MAKEARRPRSRANGEGTIYQRQDGYWVAALFVDGKRKPLYGKTRAQVEKRLRDERSNQEQGLPVITSPLTAGDYLTEWVKTMEQEVRPSTWKAYESLIRLHAAPALANVRLIRLSAEDIERVCREAPVSPATRRKLHAVLHRALEDAVRHNKVARNVAKMARPVKAPRPEMETLSQAEALQLLDAARDDHLEALYVLALTTGMRQGEMLALRWRDVDLESGWLRVTGTLQRGRNDEFPRIAEPKTPNSRRRLDLAPTAIEALMRHKELQGDAVTEPPGLVFPNSEGRPWDGRNLVQREFGPLLKRANVKRIRFHDLRHTAATLMLELGINPKVASEMLGHSNVSITLQLYSHALPGMHKAASELLGLALTRPALATG